MSGERQNIASGDPYEEVFGYFPAVRVGDHIQVSATAAQDPFLHGCDTFVQARKALDIITTTLEEAHAGLSDVVRTAT